MPLLLLSTNSHVFEEINKTDSRNEPIFQSTARFPEQLFALLCDKRNEEAIKWSHDGTQFSIVNRQKLCCEVLPRYFEQISAFKYVSFARKLSRWNFKRSSRGMDTRIFSHPLFQRDKPALCLKIRCKNKVKKVKRSFDSKPLQHNSISSHISERSEKVSLFTPSCNEKSKPLSILHGFRISDLERIYALEKLRHDATILYDYPKTPVLLPRFTESFSDKSTNARTQTIIDAAVAAMKRCDETI